MWQDEQIERDGIYVHRRRPYHRWTAAENAYIVANYPSTPSKVMAARPGLSQGKVKAQAAILGVRRERSPEPSKPPKFPKPKKLKPPKPSGRKPRSFL
jgi:hypothetical protein